MKIIQVIEVQDNDEDDDVWAVALGDDGEMYCCTISYSWLNKRYQRSEWAIIDEAQ